MRTTILLSAVLMMGSAHIAFAQETTMQKRGSAEWPAGATAAPSVSPMTTPDTTTATAPEPTGAIPPLPLRQRTSSNGVPYISGGIGDEELAELKTQSANYNVQLLLTGSTGEYLSQATVHVTDATGADLFTADNVGPFVYFNLKPGKYTLNATAQAGSTNKMDITVPATGPVKPQLRFTE